MQLALGQVPLENPMNHKLRVFVRMDVDPANVTLEISGCVAPSDSAALMHIVRRACRLAAGLKWSSTSMARPIWTRKCCWTFVG